MILGYFGDKVTEKELAARVKIRSFGVFTTDLGVQALDRGFQTVVYTFHLPLLGPLELPFGTKITRRSLASIKARPANRKVYKSWQEYLEKGGQLIWESPKLFRLKYWLNKKFPCLLNFNTAALRRFYRNWDNGHQVVAVGMQKDQVWVVDSDPEGIKKKFKITSENLLPAWAINAKNSSGYLLVTWPKKFKGF